MPVVCGEGSGVAADIADVPSCPVMPDINFSKVNGCPLGGATIFTSAEV